jgi:ABC-type nitrate/sulfonate/bicarbonate transport systems, periplasmic components
MAVVSLAACSPTGGSAGSTSSEIQDTMTAVDYDCAAPDDSTTIDISVVAMPIVSNGAIFAGIDEGFFEKHGLNVEVSTVSSVPATIAAVQGGTTDFAFTGTIGAFQAIDQDIPLTIVAPFAGIEPGYWDKMQAGEEGYTREITALLVGPDSGIEDPGDLDGKTVAVGDARGQAELTPAT